LQSGVGQHRFVVLVFLGSFLFQCLFSFKAVLNLFFLLLSSPPQRRGVSRFFFLQVSLKLLFSRRLCFRGGCPSLATTPRLDGFLSFASFRDRQVYGILAFALTMVSVDLSFQSPVCVVPFLRLRFLLVSLCIFGCLRFFSSYPSPL